MEVVENNFKLVGIVTRSDIIRTKHQNKGTTLSGSQQKARELLSKLPHVAS